MSMDPFLIHYFELQGVFFNWTYPEFEVLAGKKKGLKKTSESHTGPLLIKHRKNCECCPGHYLFTNVYLVSTSVY